MVGQFLAEFPESSPQRHVAVPHLVPPVEGPTPHVRKGLLDPLFCDCVTRHFLDRHARHPRKTHRQHGPTSLPGHVLCRPAMPSSSWITAQVSNVLALRGLTTASIRRPALTRAVHRHARQRNQPSTTTEDAHQALALATEFTYQERLKIPEQVPRSQPANPSRRERRRTRSGRPAR
ncbi:hypothetical protein OHB06_00805 [Streptomyces sp. NBC_01604]|uniref:hypothetical protein n=1 Tax=Streptomyces sp. NBC_01604 TaxID=2975894 RepID=UPI003869D3BC